MPILYLIDYILYQFGQSKKICNVTDELVISTAKLLKTEKKDQIQFIFPFQDPNLLLVKGYIHPLNNSIPDDITQLIWKFYGYDRKQRYHWTMTYNHPLSKVVSTQNFIEVLHPRKMESESKFAIPVVVFDYEASRYFGRVYMNMFATVLRLRNTFKLLDLSVLCFKCGQGIFTRIIAFILWPFSFSIWIWSKKIGYILAKSKCIEIRHGFTRDIVKQF